MRGMERERDAKIHTPTDVKHPSLFILVRRVRCAHTEEGESEAKAHSRGRVLAHTHTHACTGTDLVVSNEGLVSESIINFPSGGIMAP